MTYAEHIAQVGSWESDLKTGEGPWSDEAYRIAGFERGEVIPSTETMLSIVHPDDLESVKAAIAQPLVPGEQRPFEMRFVMKDGSVRNILARMEVVFGPDGNPVRLRGTCQDVTEQKEADRAHEKLEEQLRVAQKMEAVGSLAGGIAHDFNNLLSVILSYVGFVLDASPAPDPRHDDLMEIQKAAERAAVLTRQLLAFGRRQILQPVPMNLNDSATGVEGMLRRVIGEDIRLVQRLDPQLALVMADPGQIEQVVMNLVVNSRDAMPDGGTLTIETENVELAADQVDGLKAGPYVMFVVSDTGTGMDGPTKARLFEPFFTTKPVGKGTGLGLSTVFGIVKQSGGNVRVYSEPGMGTTFRVYLPRDMSATPAAAKAPAPTAILLGTETILVVEDEAAVRNSTSRVLTAAGYTVLTAEHGADALTQCEAHDGLIDLVLTDVVMPKLGGAPFARELAKVRPEIRILFMSGYSGDAIVHKGILDAGTQFIGKPFSASDLTHKVREVLDADRDAYPTDPTDIAPQVREK